MTFTDDGNRGLRMESHIFEFFYEGNLHYILLKDSRRIWSVIFKIIQCRWTKSAVSGFILRWWGHQPRRIAMFKFWIISSTKPHHRNRDLQNQIISDKLSKFRGSPKFRSRYMVCFTAIISLVSARILFDHYLFWWPRQVWKSKTPPQMRKWHSLMMEITAFGCIAIFLIFFMKEISSTFY